MSGVISTRLFPLLQLTRMALVFTAISNSLCTLLLAWARLGGDMTHQRLFWREAGLVALISTGLYGFGMSLNDIIDRRRDRLLAAHRPLPSGRIRVSTAHFICAALILLALGAGALYAMLAGPIWMSFLLVLWTGALIVFYDLAAKYLVALGLLSLGLIRFFHAVIPAPQLPLLWHPLLLLNHVTVLSLVAYRWEEKRPPLTPIHWAAVPGGLAVIDAMLIALLAWRRTPQEGGSVLQALRVTPALIAPAAAVIVFLILAALIRRLSTTPREAGQRLMLYGLLWLIVYDFTFVAGYVGLAPALLLLLLLPLAYASVQVMRWWGGIVALSQRPQFKRIET
jgi:4-hydroxybenzoate polyprenyltransferase